MTAVQMRRDGEIAVVTVDNPPVNALKYEVRAGILDAFAKASDDASVKAIVLAAAGRTFIAGREPMFYGDQVGVRYIREQLAHYAAASGDTSLQPAAYLNKLADEGRGFASLAEAAKKSA